jgi:hypothetical protein
MALVRSQFRNGLPEQMMLLGKPRSQAKAASMPWAVGSVNGPTSEKMQRGLVCARLGTH